MKREEYDGVPAQGYFEEALSNFTKDFAYGGAIRHLAKRGYTLEQIVKEFHYPVSNDYITKIIEEVNSKN